jgi:hypothetical protein
VNPELGTVLIDRSATFRAQVIAMSVRDHGTRDRLPRVDVKAARGAEETVRCRLD